MKLQIRARQRGMSLFSMLFVGAVLAGAGVVGAQVFPTYLEYLAVGKAVNKAKEGTTVSEIRGIFDKAASVDYITSITSKELEISKDSDQVVVKFDYSKDIHLVGPAWLVLRYSGRSR